MLRARRARGSTQRTWSAMHSSLRPHASSPHRSISPLMRGATMLYLRQHTSTRGVTFSASSRAGAPPSSRSGVARSQSDCSSLRIPSTSRRLLFNSLLYVHTSALPLPRLPLHARTRARSPRSSSRRCDAVRELEDLGPKRFNRRINLPEQVALCLLIPHPMHEALAHVP